jgi:hypothetical protein
MAFVPFVQPPPPSPRAYELGRRLKETIDGFRQQNPNVTSADIRQAMQLAQRGTGAESQKTALAIAVALLVLGLLAAFYFLRRPGEANSIPMTAVVMGAAAVILVLKVFLRNR